MAAGYNRIILVGNLTRDPEHKQLPSGQSICRLGLATNRQFPNRQTGAMVQEVCFIDVDVWGAQAESCRQYLSKGRPVLVEGRLKFDSWDDQNGQKRSKHSIVADRVVFLGNGAEAEFGSEKGETVDPDMMPREPQNEMERGLMNQIEQIKNRAKAAAQPQRVAPAQPAQAVASIGEVNFTDQPPFQDDLPF
jgi:single-strand DNA-binding protein